MDRFIMKNYGINVNDIQVENKDYLFNCNGNHFIFKDITSVNYNIDNIIEIDNALYSKGIILNRIVKDLMGKYEVINEDKKYMLFIIYNNNANIENIINFSKQDADTIHKNDWHDLWCNKIDYYEYQMNQFGNRYSLLRESFSYVVGIAEIGIMLINTVDFKNAFSCYSHKRINDFYCPLNICIDSRVRDISEYIKERFFKGENCYSYLDYYLKNSKLTNEEYKLLFCRLLLITPYFDLYEKIMDGNEKEETIKKIILYLNDYEMFIKNIYKLFKTYVNIDEIPFLFSN